MTAIKNHLKQYFIKMFDENGPISDDKIEKRRGDYRAEQEARSRVAEIKRVKPKKRLLVAPRRHHKADSRKHPPPPITRNAKLCRARERSPAHKWFVTDIDHFHFDSPEVQSNLLPEDVDSIEIPRDTICDVVVCSQLHTSRV